MRGGFGVDGGVYTTRRYRLHIVAERVEEIRHCLLTLPGTRRGDLRRVISDPQALTHCDSFIRGLPGVVREAVGDTAAAAKMVADNGWRCATTPSSSFIESCICSSSAMGRLCTSRRFMAECGRPSAAFFTVEGQVFGFQPMSALLCRVLHACRSGTSATRATGFEELTRLGSQLMQGWCVAQGCGGDWERARGGAVWAAGAGARHPGRAAQHLPFPRPLPRAPRHWCAPAVPALPTTQVLPNLRSALTSVRPPHRVPTSILLAVRCVPWFCCSRHLTGTDVCGGACSPVVGGAVQDVGGVFGAGGAGAAVQGAERAGAARPGHDQDRVAAHAQQPHPACQRRRCCMNPPSPATP